MAIVINGSGTVTGLAVGGLPDGTVDAGTLATNSVDSAELIDGAVDNSHMAAMAASKLTGALPAISGASLTGFTDAQMPAGSVLQVIHAQSTGAVSTTSTSNWADTTCTAAITPSSTSSKVMILMAHHSIDSSTTASDADIRLLRGSTNIKDVTKYMGESLEGNFNMSCADCYLDSPNTTSATTYKTQIKIGDGSGTVAVNVYVPSSITLMEIAG